MTKRPSYPTSWNGLTLPDVRAELLSYLEDAAELNVVHDTPTLTFLVHFIFDDHDFGADASAEIGSTLLNAEEAAVVREFAHALASAIGPRSKPLKAVTERDWAPVIVTARAAHTKLTESGAPTFI